MQDIAAEEDASEGEETAMNARVSELLNHRTESCVNTRENEEVREALLRMRVALTRTQPSQRSCRVRLALAEWLHRRLRRSRLRIEDQASLPQYSKSLLLYRMQVALLRCTLRQQLSELTWATAATSADKPRLLRARCRCTEQRSNPPEAALRVNST